MLAIASSKEQQARDRLTVETWGTGLTTDQFLEREQRLRAHPWAAAALTTWLWKDASGAILCSCEVFLDEAKAFARTGTAATIASVFTEPRLRAQGHAAKMLQALIVELRSCLAVTLFSEIGTHYYQRLGFCPVPAFDTFFEPRADAPAIEWLRKMASPRHLSGDAHTLRLSLSAERLDWHLERERIYGSAMKRGPLPHCGAQVGESTITWTAYWKTNELQVLSLDAKSPAELALLIHAASHAAQRGGLSTVRIWETTDLTSVPGAHRVARTDEVAMFLPLVPGLQAWTMVERGLWA